MIAKPKFKETFCSHCGEGFGPGDSGFSSCEQHPGWRRDRLLKRQAAARKGAATRRRNQDATNWPAHIPPLTRRITSG